MRFTHTNNEMMQAAKNFFPFSSFTFNYVFIFGRINTYKKKLVTHFKGRLTDVSLIQDPGDTFWIPYPKSLIIVSKFAMNERTDIQYINPLRNVAFFILI